MEIEEEKVECGREGEGTGEEKKGEPVISE